MGAHVAGHGEGRLGRTCVRFSVRCDEENGRMERSSLEVLLAQGLSLAEIGRRFGRHEATVAYWIRKYGLASVNHEKHVAKGALSREELLSLVEAGMSSSEIAESLGRSKSTVRHWLREYGLQTQWAQRPPSIERAPRDAHACVYTPRRDAVQTQDYGRLPVFAVPHGGRHAPTAQGQADSRSGDRRRLHFVWL
jgi:transposase